MATSSRAPKQWCLTKRETFSSFEAWRQNLIYILSLDSNFDIFLAPGASWTKKAGNHPTRGLQADDESVPENKRRTAQQKMMHLQLMLGQIANYCPIISRSTFERNATSLNDIWQAIRLHFGFQSTGSHFLDLAEIKQEPEERAEDLYQRIMSFTEDNLLKQDSIITHHGTRPTVDEDFTPTVENWVVFTWLQLLHPNLPRLVKQKYGTELRNKTLASIKPEISNALPSLLDELHATEDISILRSAHNSRHGSRNQGSRTRTDASCPLCKTAGRSHGHFLSRCKFLPETDRKFLTKARQVAASEENEDADETDEDVTEVPDKTPNTYRVEVKRSPQLKSFYKHHPLNIVIDTGAETNMIRESTAKYIRAKIVKSSQMAFQADGQTPLHVTGETTLQLSRNGMDLHLEALVVRDLDVDVLGGIPFMVSNDISVRPAKAILTIAGAEVINYGKQPQALAKNHTVRCATLLRAPPISTTIWPGEFLELSVPDDLHEHDDLIIEPRATSNKSQTHNGWPSPDIVQQVGSKIRIINNTASPQRVNKNEHLCQVSPISESPVGPPTNTRPKPLKIHSSTTPFSDEVQIDNGNKLSDTMRQQFREVTRDYDNVFNPSYPGYNGAVGPFKAIVNMGPVQPPQRKGRLPQYGRDRLSELQDKFDELEALGVFKRPEDINVNVEYLNPSFLVRKSNGGSRLVTAFTEVAQYAKPQPSLMPDVESTLRTIGGWQYIITTDLTSAFYQIPLDRQSMKYCGVATPYKGVRVYTRSAMGMPGSETALEELMSRVLGDLIHEGIVTKLADDLYIGGESPDALLDNWRRTLHALAKCDLRLSAKKTSICPAQTTVLGWTWSQGNLTASKHRLSTLSMCERPTTVRNMRAFIGAYKTLGRVLPKCAAILAPLENSIAGRESKDKVQWSDSLVTAFTIAQDHLQKHHTVSLPRASDKLWIVTDASVKEHGLGATLYIQRNGKMMLAGFYSAKTKKHQVTWLPCEMEALAIATAVKHFSPYLIQSDHKAIVLTDSKPCVQAYQRLCRGEFSNSPRVSTFLSTISRYQMSVLHLAGTANLPSDFSSRNAPECDDDGCQVCTFVHKTEESVIRQVCTDDILCGKSHLPYTSRSAWNQTQLECSDLRRVHAHLTQGTRPHKKETNIKDVKRYLQVATISRDGLLVVRRDEPLSPTREAIIVPRQVLDGLLVALHIKLGHPTRHQLRLSFQRGFYALDLERTLTRVTESCHLCASLKTIPPSLQEQTTSDPPECPGISFAADVLKRARQVILMVRETITSYTRTAFLTDEKADTLRSGLIGLCLELSPLEGPPCVIRVDGAPGFKTLASDKVLRSHNITIEIGRTKNINKNPVAERAVQELEREIVRLEPGGGPITHIQLAVATAHLNSRIRNRGLSAREMWFKRDQTTNEAIPVSDQELIMKQNEARNTNHPSSSKAKSKGMTTTTQNIRVGDLIFLKTEKDKHRARDRYLVVNIDGEWASIRKFIGSQLRATSYKVKLQDCYKVPSQTPSSVEHHREQESDDESPILPPASHATPAIDEDVNDINIPDVLSAPETAYTDELDATHDRDDDTLTPDQGLIVPESFVNVTPPPPLRRSTRIRKRPVYFDQSEL